MKILFTGRDKFSPRMENIKELLVYLNKVLLTPLKLNTDYNISSTQVVTIST